MTVMLALVGIALLAAALPWAQRKADELLDDFFDDWG